jgi:hypothetical protein
LDGLSGEAFLRAVNQDLARRGLRVAVAKAECLVKPGFEAQGISLFAFDHYLRIGERWVPGDDRREALGNSLTYLTVMSTGAANPGLPATETEAAIDRCFTTWKEDVGCVSLDLVKRTDTGADATILDYYLDLGASAILPGRHRECGLHARGVLRSAVARRERIHPRRHVYTRFRG